VGGLHTAFHAVRLRPQGFHRAQRFVPHREGQLHAPVREPEHLATAEIECARPQMQVAVADAGGFDLHQYLPGAGQRFLRRFKPVLGVLMETEIWPNLYRACGGERIPLAIINGRLSERSARGYGRLRRFTTDTLQHVSMIAAQTSDDGQRFVEIGARPETISVMGNIKFDYRVPEGLAEVGATLRRELFGSRPVWMRRSLAPAARTVSATRFTMRVRLSILSIRSQRLQSSIKLDTTNHA